MEQNLDYISHGIFKGNMKKLEKKSAPTKSCVLESAGINRYLIESPRTAENLQVGVCLIQFNLFR